MRSRISTGLPDEALLAGAARPSRTPRRAFALYLLLCASVIAGCEGKASQGTPQELQSAEPENKAIGGFADIKLGQDFSETLAAHGKEFDPHSLQSCQEDLPINGCTLTTPRDGAPFRMIEGIPYRLDVKFNKEAKVTDVELEYSRNGKGINGEDCRAILRRTLEWLMKDYGHIYSDAGKDAREVGVPTDRSKVGGSSDWAFFARSSIAPPSNAMLKKGLSNWDDRRYVAIDTFFNVVDGEARCTINVAFKEPDKVPRQDPMRALDLATEALPSEI